MTDYRVMLREGDPPHHEGKLRRANGYAFIPMAMFEGGLSYEARQEAERLLAKARAFDEARDWDREQCPDGYTHACLFSGVPEIAVPLEMLTP